MFSGSGSRCRFVVFSGAEFREFLRASLSHVNSEVFSIGTARTTGER